MTHTKVSIFFLILILMASTVQAKEKSFPTLKKVMSDLAVNMGSLDRGIFYEDFALIAKSAAKVADHPAPKNQLPTVIKELGKEMPKFKKFDLKVHDAAKNIVAQAQNNDMNGILKNHTIIMENCVSCHLKYRKRISKLFNK